MIWANRLSEHTSNQYKYSILPSTWASQVPLVVKNPSVNAGDIRDVGSILGLGSPRGRHGNPFQDSCLENPMDRGAWRVTVHGVEKSWAQLKQLSTHKYIIKYI